MLLLDAQARRWLDFVEAAPNASFFHHPAWCSLVADCYRFRPFALAVADESGTITAGLPVNETQSPLGGPRWVSLPFTDHCPPLASSEEALTQLTLELDRLRDRNGISRIEVRGRLEGPNAHLRSGAVTHTLGLTGDPTNVFRKFKPSTRRNVLQAQRRGLAIRRQEARKDLTEAFYRLHLKTRRRLGVPVQPRRLFELIWDRVIERGHGFLVLAYAEGVPVAGALFLAWNGTITYKYGASDADFLGLRPNNLIFWHAIEWACENGYKSFDFGRTELDNKGLRSFKDGWGAHEERLVYATLADAPGADSLAPLSAAARPIIRRSPLWVCRLLGELLYRYAA